MLFRILLSLIIALSISSVAFANSHVGMMFNNSMFVPLRGVFQDLGCEVKWNGETKIINIKSKEKEVSLKIGANTANINGSTIEMKSPAKIVNGSVYVPLRFCAESFGAEVKWNQAKGQANIIKGDNNIVVVIEEESAADLDIKNYVEKFGNVTATVVEIPYNKIRTKVVLGQNQIGGTEELASMASRSGAIVAINGTFFEAYDGRPDPWNAIISNGKVLHIGSIGTTIGFTNNGSAKMAPVRYHITGDGWYSYGINHTPQENGGVFIYTPERGRTIGFTRGTSIVVSSGEVIRKIKNKDVLIPRDGFVINCSGVEKQLANKFDVGDSVNYQVSFANVREDDWSDVVTAIGAGPRLVMNGQVAVNPIGEGFTENKITQLSGARSAIGIKPNGTIILVTVRSATVNELASIMKNLDAYNAMNLDGGASSGLWLDGKYLTKPGRLLSNALIFY